MEDADAPLPETFACPHCGQMVEVDDQPAGAWITCPACGEQFALPEASPELEEESPRDEEELDGMRIRNVSVARRSAIRSRSYAMIATAACGAAVVQLGFMTYRHFRYHLGPVLKPIGYILCIIAGIWAIVFFLRRATELKHEAAHSALSEPTTPPDFSNLSDGSQQLRNLEQMK